MGNLKKIGGYILILFVMAILVIASITVLGKKVSNTMSSISNALPDSVPSETFPNIPTSINLPSKPEITLLQQQLQEIDQTLSQTMQSNIAYNAPSAMQLNETAIIELLINPSKSPAQLENQITEAGPVVTATVEITSQMRAELISPDNDVFFIQPIHKDSEQLIGITQTTRWAWQVTAKQGGNQKLTLVIYRLVKFEGKEYWREVQTYKADIDVKVSFGQWLKMLDWKWIVGIVFTAVLIPAFWRWIDQRRKQNETVETGKEKVKSHRKNINKKH